VWCPAILDQGLWNDESEVAIWSQPSAITICKAVISGHQLMGSFGWSKCALSSSRSDLRLYFDKTIFFLFPCDPDRAIL
jgi:hypothetical protein